MRILLVNNRHYVGGGSERVYQETARLLVENGHEVALVSTIADGETMPKERGIYYKDNGHRAYRPDRFFYKRNVAADMANFVRQWKPDIAHLHIFYGRLTSAVLPPLKSSMIPTVMSVHEYRMLCPTYLFRDGKGRICEKCANGNYWHAVTNKCNKGSYIASAAVAAECKFRDRFFYYPRFIERFIFVSRFCRDIHLKYRPHITPQSDVLYNFSDISPTPAKPSGGAYFLYTGRLSPEKGVITLLKAAQGYAKIRLRVAGRGPDEIRLKKLSEDLHLSARVDFLGHLDEQHLLEQIRGAKFVVVPSECYENMPLAVIEAFAQGVPVIGANIGGIPELVANEATGLLFEPGNVESLRSILRAANNLDDEKVDRMGFSARRVIEEKCNRRIYYRRLMDIYRKAKTDCVERARQSNLTV